MRSVSALVRASAAVVAVGVTAAALTACSSDPKTDCATALTSGPASELVSVSGEIGSAPEVEVPSPVFAAESQRTVLIEGDGETVHAGQVVTVGFTILDGRTGRVIQEGYGSQAGLIALGADDLSRGLQCVTVGSRVVVAGAPAADAAPDGKREPAELYVLDVLATSLSAADGAPRPAVSGFPAVVLAPTGQPGVTIPSSRPAPTQVRSELLKAGRGALVKEDSQVFLHYNAIGWESTFSGGSWAAGRPDFVDMSSGQSQVLGQSQLRFQSQLPGQSRVLPQAMLRELVGQKTGSQLVIEVPSAGEFPAAAWVVDILGVR